MKLRFWRRKESPDPNTETQKPRKERWWRRLFRGREPRVPIERPPVTKPSVPPAIVREQIQKTSTFSPTPEFKSPEPPSLAETAFAVGSNIADAGGAAAEAAIGTTIAATDEAMGVVAEFLDSENEETNPIETKTATRSTQEMASGLSQKEVSPESIDIHTLPLNWKALAELGRKLKGFRYVISGQIDGFDFTALAPPPEAQAFIPIIASIVANRRNPEIPAKQPTEEQIRAAQPWLKTVQWFLGRFSEQLARRFGNYIDRKGTQVVNDLAERVIGFAEFAGTIENPKQQFLDECERLYQRLAAQKTRSGFWGEEEEVPIEEKVAQFIRTLQRAKQNPRALDNDSFWLNRRTFPLLIALLEKLNLPIDSVNPSNAGIVGAELMEGIYAFLRGTGIQNLPPPLKAREVDIFDPSTWGRGLAEWLYPHIIEHVKRDLPGILSLAHEATPESGPALRDKIYEIAENICTLHKRGVSPEEIAKRMFPGMKTIRVEGQNRIPSPEGETIHENTGNWTVVGLIAGGVAVFYFGASIIWLPIIALVGMMVGAGIGVANVLRRINRSGKQ